MNRFLPAGAGLCDRATKSEMLSSTGPLALQACRAIGQTCYTPHHGEHAAVRTVAAEQLTLDTEQLTLDTGRANAVRSRSTIKYEHSQAIDW